MLKKRIVIPAAIIAGIVLAIVLYNIFVRYTDFEIQAEIRKESTQRTNYARQFSGLLAYNPDGVTLMDYDGVSRWNISFEMQNPQLDAQTSYALIYDKRGTTLELTNSNGEATRLNTAYPITMASVSENGRVAAVMRQGSLAYVNLYDNEGELVAEGRMHSTESGYPISMSLSSSGDILVISSLRLSESDVKTDIIFYDFSDSGSLKENNRAAQYSYSNEVIPLVDHISGDRVIAIGGTQAVVFTAGSEPKVSHELFFDSEVKSVFHNKDYFGIITESENENIEIDNIMELYTYNCSKRFSHKISNSYTDCHIMDNNEILVTDGKKTSIYTGFGVEKFYYEFPSDIQNMIPGNNSRSYYLLQNGTLSRIRLK